MHELVITVDHKKLGIMYIGTGLFFLAVAGACLDYESSSLCNNHLIPPRIFNRLFTMHGTAMVFLVGMPIIAGLRTILCH